MTSMTDNRTTELQSLSKLKKAGKLRYWRGSIEIPETELHAICDEIQAEHEQAIAATLGTSNDIEKALIDDMLDFIGNCCETTLDCGCCDPVDCKYLDGDGELAECTRYQDFLSRAKAINATLRSDDEYEAKMDELLCRLTNGKWSKSRAYSLDFMVSCVDEEYEDAYEKERAELWSGMLTAEQVREAIMSADRWEKPMGNTGLTNTHLIIRDDGWQAIADELNAELGSGTCELIDRGKFTPHHDFHRVECSECGVLFWQSHGHLPPARFCPSCGKRCIHNE